MGKIYDDWEKLVEAVVRREQLLELAMSYSRASSTSSEGSSRLSFNSSTSMQFNDQLPETNFTNVKYRYHWDVALPLNPSLFVMAGATNLSISCGESSETWQGYHRHGYNFWDSEVVELKSVSRFDIRCKIKTLMLSRNTIYGAYMVYELIRGANGLKAYSLHPAKAMIIIDNYESDADAGARVVEIGWTGDFSFVNIDDHDEVTTRRKDGWIEVQLGSFYVGHEDFEVVEARLSANEGWGMMFL